MHGRQQRLDGFGGAGEGEAFDGPASRVFVGIFQMSSQNLHHPVGSDAAVPHQTERPQRPNFPRVVGRPRRF